MFRSVEDVIFLPILKYNNKNKKYDGKGNIVINCLFPTIL